MWLLLLERTPELSESALQFGQYRGKTFKWLLSNDVGHAAMKLAGDAAGTAAWVTEGQGKGKGLLSMCSGLVEHYRRAGEAHPQVLYVDRDCCSTGACIFEWDAGDVERLKKACGAASSPIKSWQGTVIAVTAL
ncbi:hypothetical protein QQF64_031685 [Cirrhinus molitorella]|uniref:Uncharacterized protein n=1 Tax=Cirrhinus molitorella TaxID=172907 RepID=A0ABR3MXN0_9TELE